MEISCRRIHKDVSACPVYIMRSLRTRIIGVIIKIIIIISIGMICINTIPPDIIINLNIAAARAQP
jgi:hypothetical protein